jgi:hypothetical protein
MMHSRLTAWLRANPSADGSSTTLDTDWDDEEDLIEDDDEVDPYDDSDVGDDEGQVLMLAASVPVLAIVPSRRKFLYLYEPENNEPWEHACLIDRALPVAIAERMDERWPVPPTAFRGWGWIPDANERLWDTLPEGTGPYGSWRPTTRGRPLG